MAVAYVSSSPTIDQFAEILLQEEGATWSDIGVFLGASAAEIRGIRQNYATHGAATCLIELHECLAKKGKSLTWEAIATALRRLGNNRLADSIHSKYILPFTMRRGDYTVTNVRESSIYGTGGGVDRVPVCAACRMKEKQIKQLHIDADALQQKYDNLTAEYNAFKMKKDTDVKVLVRQLKEKDAAFIELTRENEQLKDKLKFHEVESAVVRSKRIEPESREHNGSPQNYMDVLRKFYGDIRRSIKNPMDFSEKLLEVKFITFDEHDSNCEATDKDSVRHRLMRCIRARVQDNPQNLLTLVDKVLKPDCSNDTLCQNIMKEISK